MIYKVGCFFLVNKSLFYAVIKLLIGKTHLTKAFSLLILLILVTNCSNRSEESSHKTSGTEEDNVERSEFADNNAKKSKEKKVFNSSPLMTTTQLNLMLPEVFGEFKRMGGTDIILPDSLGIGDSPAIGQVYVDNSGNKFKIVLIDYKSNEGSYDEVMDQYINTADAGDIERKFSIQDEVIGKEYFYENTKHGKIIAGVGARFLVVLDAENQANGEYVKEVLLDVMPIATLLDK